MWFDEGVRTPLRIVIGLALFAVWAAAKYRALLEHVWRPNEYSDTYYYFLQAEAALASGRPLAVMTPEYPTPAAGLLLLPYLLGGEGYDAYRWNFLVLVVGVDALFAVLLIWRAGPVGLLSWTLLETLSGRLALLRFDVIPAVLAASAVLLLLRRRDAAASQFAVLGAAVKLWPALLLPLALGDRRTRERVAFRALAGGLLLVVLSIFAGGLERLLSPLIYQRDRGLQIESVAASMPMLARMSEPGYAVFWSKWNAYEITGPGVAGALAATTPASVVGIGLFAVLLARWYRAGAPPATSAHLALFSIAAFMVTSKALSPQYFLWLAAPAAALLGDAFDPPYEDAKPGQGNLPRTAAGSVVLTGGTDAARQVAGIATVVWVALLMMMTTYVYPKHYDALLHGTERSVVDVLVARNAALVAFMAWCAVASWVGSPPGRGPEGGRSLPPSG